MRNNGLDRLAERLDRVPVHSRKYDGNAHLRGPDASGTWISQHCALGHRRLSVMDPENGAQPMVRKQGDYTYTIVYNGELYNAPELKKELELRGHHFRTTCDTEVLLVAFIEWGELV